jgi:hypothetical protein
MKTLIRKILKEEFQNDEVISSEHNICDVMMINSWEEIQELLDNMDYDNQFQSEIDDIRNKMNQELDTLSSDLDVANTYLRKIQNIVCK